MNDQEETIEGLPVEAIPVDSLGLDDSPVVPEKVSPEVRAEKDASAEERDPLSGGPEASPDNVSETLPKKEGRLVEAVPSLKKLNLGGFFGISGGKISEFLLNFLIPLLCLVGTGALTLLLLLPSYREVPGLETTLSSREALSSQLSRKVSALRELEDFGSVLEGYSFVVDGALVSEPKVPELLSQVDNMVRSSGMAVSSLNYSQSGSSALSGVETVNVSLSSSGSFDSLVAFMKSIENASRLVLLKDFRYSSSRGDNTEISASFQLSSPYLFVSSSAVTDDPIDLSINSPEFLRDIRNVQELSLYDSSSAPVVLDTSPEVFTDPEQSSLVEDPGTIEGEVSPEDPPEDSPEDIPLVGDDSMNQTPEDSSGE